MNLPGMHMVDSNLKIKGNIVKQVTWYTSLLNMAS